MTRFFCCFIAEVAEAATTVQNPDPFEGLCEQFKNQAFFSPSNSVNSSLFTKVSIDLFFSCGYFLYVSGKYFISGNTNFLDFGCKMIHHWFLTSHREFFAWLSDFFVTTRFSSNFLKGPFKMANFWA